MGTFKDLIFSDVPKTRQALRKLLDGPIMVSPVVVNESRKGFAFEGRTKLGPLVDPSFI